MSILEIRKKIQLIDECIKKEYPTNPPFNFSDAIKILSNAEKTGITQLSDQQSKELDRVLKGFLPTLTNPRALPDLYVSQVPGGSWFKVIDQTVDAIKKTLAQSK